MLRALTTKNSTSNSNSGQRLSTYGPEDSAETGSEAVKEVLGKTGFSPGWGLYLRIRVGQF